ncbi:MAG: signal peptide peptidase SppA [Candidatus Aminicenantes bacterium]|nr:MAG: signal peptide peptidase SppA [Candidatus Aminicenantes bacterium]
MKKGILIAILVIVILLIFLALAAGYVYMQLNREPDIPKNSFLKIQLQGPIVETNHSVFSRELSIRELWYHIKRAKIDRRIRGIILKISYMKTGLAKIEDMGRLIKDFRESGKKVYAYIEGGGIKEYYLSTFADKIYVFKGGFLFLKGLAAEAMFLKNTLDKLGIQAQLFHIGEYKTASNIFTKDRMTPAHKESLERLLDDIYTSTLAGIAANRHLDIESLEKIFEESPITNQDYLEAKLIDDVLYEDEVLNDAKEDYVTVSFDIYQGTKSPRPYEGIKKIAVIFASGEIHPGKSGRKSLFGDEVLGSDTVVAQLRAAKRNRLVKAVVLRIDSPGGSALASDAIRREAEMTAKKKPLVISMADVAASGGYWVSMSTPHVMALPQTITGSIGVITGKFVLKDLYDKIGINKEMVKTSKYADMFWDYREFSQDEQDKMWAVMKHIYQLFLEVVAKSRKMKAEEVDKIARGRVWAGISALNLKLVDQLGGLHDAIIEAKKLAKIPATEPVGIKIYPRKKSFLETVFELIGAKAKTQSPVVDVDLDPVRSLETKLNMYKKFFPALIMPYKITID